MRSLSLLLLAGSLTACALIETGATNSAVAAEANGAPAAASTPLGFSATLARSREGRALRQAIFGHGPRRVVWVGGIHGDEREGAHASLELG
ncbi:MAG: hypothetical protein HOP15_02385, partial [Planctomycetes bacterium]|nr:hypothetical protein [Planctomycetota bacterium]